MRIIHRRILNVESSERRASIIKSHLLRFTLKMINTVLGFCFNSVDGIPVIWRCPTLWSFWKVPFGAVRISVLSLSFCCDRWHNLLTIEGYWNLRSIVWYCNVDERLGNILKVYYTSRLCYGSRYVDRWKINMQPILLTTVYVKKIKGASRQCYYEDVGVIRCGLTLSAWRNVRR